MESFYPFPEMSGTEEEIRLTISERSDRDSKEDLTALLRGMDHFCPPLPGNNEFRANGSRTYFDTRGIEIATPEVNNPVDQLIYIEAGVRILSDTITNYLLSESKRTNTEQYAILQRRVIDSDGNTWGVHDNFSVYDNEYLGLVSHDNTNVALIWNGYLNSRGLINGAMRVDNSLSFSQKLSAEHSYNGKSFSNSLLHADYEDGSRLELRCSDVNLQEWAFISRIGGAALVLAATQTELVVELAKNYRSLMSQNIAAWNIIPLNSDLELRADAALLSAIDIQHYTMSNILEKLEDYTDQPVPRMYRRIGENILQFCEDLESVAYGRNNLETLVGRADWAGKLVVLREHIRRNPSGRRLGDAKSRLLDLWYDQISISVNKEGEPGIAYGFGYMQAKANQSQSYESAIDNATKNPPPNTRAAQRVVNSLKLGSKVEYCSWNKLLYNDNEVMREMLFDS